MKKSSLAKLLLSLSLISLIAGCGETQSGNPNGDQPTNPTPPSNRKIS